MKARFAWRRFSIALALSLAWHLTVVVPRVIGQLILKHEKELEVTWVAPDEPGAADETQPEAIAEREREKEKAKAEREKDLPKPPEVAVVERKPEEKTPEPEKQPVPPQPMPKMDHRKQMVHQEHFPDEEDNPDAKYLAERNHRAAQETRTNDTNLVREAQGERAPSEKSENRTDQTGGAEEKIAELESREGPEKTIPRAPPLRGDEGARTGPETKGPLSMRDLTPRTVEKSSPQKREGVELSDPDVGNLPMARQGSDDARGSQASKRKGGKVKLTLDHHAYDRIEGYGTAEAERQKAARAEQSHKKGRWDRLFAKQAAMRSSIENFVFDVKPGNQAELGTRKNAFAGYITAMHRQIHKFWTFGFLTDLDARPSSNGPYADESLWTQLQIVVKNDGTVEKVGIVRSSGILPFDVAAIDSVMSAAPFPPPPKDIKSFNGKVYLDWQFHRDERACGTFGVDPHILVGPADQVDHDSSETGVASHERLKRMQEGPRTLSRTRTSNQEREAPIRSAPPAETPVEVPSVTPESRSAAEGWFAAYQRGDAGWLLGWSAVPFSASGQTVNDAGALKTMYKSLVSEGGAHRSAALVEMLTPGGIRGRLGGLPPGGEEKDMLFAVGKIGGDEVILLLKKASSGWRVVGLAR